MSGDHVDDLGTLKPSPLVTLGAFMVFAAGLAATAGGLQPLLVVVIFSWMKILPWSLLALGVLTTLVGGLMARARVVAAVAGLLLAGLDALLLVVWTVWAALNGYLSPLQPLGAILALVAVLFAAISLPACSRLSRARRELMS